MMAAETTSTAAMGLPKTRVWGSSFAEALCIWAAADLSQEQHWENWQASAEIAADSTQAPRGGGAGGGVLRAQTGPGGPFEPRGRIPFGEGLYEPTLESIAIESRVRDLEEQIGEYRPGYRYATVSSPESPIYSAADVRSLETTLRDLRAAALPGWGNIGSHGPVSVDTALSAAERWLGPGYVEVGPACTGVFRSSDALRQFRITGSDLTPTHGGIGPHAHFEALDPWGNVIENLHVPLLP
jgi:hypothetical protein